MYKLLTFALALVIISSLAIPAFAKPHVEKYPDCAMLPGFVTNANDSSGLAKECFDDIPIIKTSQATARLTFSELTQYCSQFNATVTLEKQCIGDYRTVDEINLEMMLVLMVAIFFISGVILVLLGITADTSNPSEQSRAYLLPIGGALVVIAISIIIVGPVLVLWEFHPVA